MTSTSCETVHEYLFHVDGKKESYDLTYQRHYTDQEEPNKKKPYYPYIV